MMAEEQRTWSAWEIRDLIQIEVSTGQTMGVLNAAISSCELNTAVSQIAASAYSGFETQELRIASQ